MPDHPHINHPKIVSQSHIYSLSHLSGFDHRYEGLDSASGQVTRFDVRVLFDDHCYTSDVAHDASHAPAEVVSCSVCEVLVFNLER